MELNSAIIIKDVIGSNYFDVFKFWMEHFDGIRRYFDEFTFGIGWETPVLENLGNVKKNQEMILD